MMKKALMVLFSCFSLAFMVAAPVSAQEPGTVIRVTIPFEFNVRGKTLPAGRYEISRISDASETLGVYNRAAHKELVFETDSIETRSPHRDGQLMFHRYGDTYFLYEIWAPGSDMGHELPRSRAERKLEHQAANQNRRPEMVALAVDEM